MNLSNLPAPVFTDLDGITQAIAALCYLGIGAAAWARAKGDIAPYPSARSLSSVSFSQ